MVASVGPTQNPVTNTFQPGVGNNNDRVGTAEQEPRTNQIQPREAQAAESQRAEDRSLARREEETQRAENPADDRSDGRRGSLVDIEV